MGLLIRMQALKHLPKINCRDAAKRCVDTYGRCHKVLNFALSGLFRKGDLSPVALPQAIEFRPFRAFQTASHISAQ
jgi:hypothetical protein